MSSAVDHRVRELAETRLRLRDDLIFTPRTADESPYYIVEDRLNSRFYRLGATEYTFVSMFHQETSIGDALSRLSTAIPEHGMTETDAAAQCRWLVECDLAHTLESSQGARLADQAEKKAAKQTVAKINPIMFRVPLANPDAWFGRLVKPLGWLYSPLAGAGWLLILLYAAYRMAIDWDRFTASSQGIFAPGNWIWLTACWLFLKVIHEISHGVVCKKYGGEVRETGVMFMLLAPLAYVDVTSSWRFASKWRRIHVAAAGIYIELLVSAIAVIVWSQSDAGWLQHFCFNVIVMSGLTTIVFNANPLMRFDGYFILSDLLAIPNLSVHSQNYLQYWSRKYLFGLNPALPNWSPRTGLIIRIYSWAAFVWRIVIGVSMTVAAATLFHGAGIVLAIFAVAAWYGLPAVRLAKYLWSGDPANPPSRIRFASIVGGAGVIIGGVLGFAPWPGARIAPAVVEYSPHVVVRSASPGFVSKIQVVGGQMVSAGQVLIVLENQELSNELNDLKFQIEQSKLRGRSHRQDGDIALQQAEAQEREGLQEQHDELKKQVDQLTICAPCAGKVVGRKLLSMQGKYIELGDELLAIGRESEKELVASISQNDLHAFRDRVGQPIAIHLPGQSQSASLLKSVTPRASNRLPHAALLASNGGPLPVRPATEANEDAAGETFELLAPRFQAKIVLTEQQARRLRPGQTAELIVRPFSETVGVHLYFLASQWLRDRFEQPAAS